MDNKVGMPGMTSLNATNYTTWKTGMEDILYVKDWYEPILRENIPSGVVAKEWEILNRKAIGTLENLCFNILLMNTMPSNFGRS